MTFRVFSNLNDSVILYPLGYNTSTLQTLSYLTYSLKKHAES